jgi:toxic protein SymE
MQRQLTVSVKYNNRGYNYIAVPAIRVEGKWLSQLGFKQGEKVKLVCRKNKLMITKIAGDRR